MWPFKKSKVNGLIKFYSLEDWWLSTFTPQEQKYIDEHFQPMGDAPHSLTQGEYTSISLPKSSFLNSLMTWFRSNADSSIATRIRNKLIEVEDEEPI